MKLRVNGPSNALLSLTYEPCRYFGTDGFHVQRKKVLLLSVLYPDQL